jgi:hypothetical protein
MQAGGRVAFGATDLLAGPIVRRVATDRVSIWVALGAPVAKVTLTVYAHTTVAAAFGPRSNRSTC